LRRWHGDYQKFLGGQALIREGIQKLIEGSDLSFEESEEIMREVMSGKATNSQTAAFLTALRMKGEAVEELIAFASVMRSNCCLIHPKVQGRLVDTCGTGGDKIKPSTSVPQQLSLLQVLGFQWLSMGIGLSQAKSGSGCWKTRLKSKPASRSRAKYH
jgi:anthranilate phosphoribosyltransferase